MKKIKATTLALALFGLGFAAQAAITDVPKILKLPMQSGGTIERKFATESSLTGWVFKAPSGEYSIIYTTADEKVLIAGAVISETGKNLTAEYADKYIPKPDFDNLFSDVEKAGTVTTGAAGKSVKADIYAVFDPNCIYCQLFYQASKVYEKAGLRVHWIPVAYLSADSEGRAAAILQAKDQGAAMVEHETKRIEKKGGITPVAATAETKAMLAKNTELMQKLKISGTPGLIFKDASGKVSVHPGMIGLKALGELTGLPVQTSTDPALARFP